MRIRKEKVLKRIRIYRKNLIRLFFSCSGLQTAVYAYPQQAPATPTYLAHNGVLLPAQPAQQAIIDYAGGLYASTQLPGAYATDVAAAATGKSNNSSAILDFWSTLLIYVCDYFSARFSQCVRNADSSIGANSRGKFGRRNAPTCCCCSYTSGPTSGCVSSNRNLSSSTCCCCLCCSCPKRSQSASEYRHHPCAKCLRPSDRSFTTTNRGAVLNYCP